MWEEKRMIPTWNVPEAGAVDMVAVGRGRWRRTREENDKKADAAEKITVGRRGFGKQCGTVDRTGIDRAGRQGPNTRAGYLLP